MLVGALVERNPVSSYHEIFKNSKLRFTLIETDGEVLYDSRKYQEEGELENHLLRPEVQEALADGKGFAIRRSSTLGDTFAYYTMRVKNLQGNEVIVRTALNYSQEMKSFIHIIIIQILFFCILNYFIHFFYKNYIKLDFMQKIKRIRRFLVSKEKMKGNYLKEDQWLSDFWEVVRDWQSQNLENIKQLDKDRRVQELIINSVDMAILLFDKKLNLIERNGALPSLFEGYRENYLEVIRYIEIIDVFKRGMSKDTGEIKEEVYIPALKRYFLVRLKFIKEDRLYLLTVKDITGSREMIEIQKKFISNISHELKTPLTNIKGYLIALEDAPEPLRKNFLNTVNSNVEKLENIVSDFLNISKIESSNILNIGEIKIEKLKENLLFSLKGIIEKKAAKVIFTSRLLKEDGYIDVDYDKVLMILKNLIENALIYNRSQEPKVDIDIIEGEDKYIIKVRDNGIGISQEEREKIFERFYRVDKARTSNVAGTGLGLAIVKEVVEKCGGEIRVHSVEGKGTEFTFTLEK